MAARVEQAELWEDLRVEAGWYHTLRGMIFDGTAGRMGGTAFLVYNVLKAHANLDSGVSFPSQERIAELVHMTTETVGAATRKLSEMGLVEEFKQGRSKRYRIIERIPLTDQEGVVIATAETQYIPKQFREMLDQVKAYAVAGILPGKQITINVNLTLVSGENATVNFNNITVDNKKSLEELARRLRLLNS